MRTVVLIAVLCGAVQAFSVVRASDARAEPDARPADGAPATSELPWEGSAADRSPSDSTPEPVSGPADKAPEDKAPESAAASKPEPPAASTSESPKSEPSKSDANASQTDVAQETHKETRHKETHDEATNGGVIQSQETQGQAPQAQEAQSEPEGAASDTGSTSVAAPALPPDPVVAIIREKLADDATLRDADEKDLAVLQRFYEAHAGRPLWATEMGLSARGLAVLSEIDKADDWGLGASDFTLPDADALPADETAQALAEIKLDLAVLQYARFARGGRYEPSKVSRLFDQTPPLRDPTLVIAEIGASAVPDDYLRSLHPSHEQFGRLQDALSKAREAEKPNETDIRRLIINMERWRWMPEDLGTLHVQLNTPEFMLYLVKDGETIFEDKTLVGTIKYATPIFSAELKTVVFNPSWVAPPSVLRDKLWPALKRKSFNIIKSNKLNVSYKGKLIDPKKVNWSRVNIHNYTFSQKAGPKNVLGKAKFLYPNKHIVYMHDTLPSWNKTFKDDRRLVGNACVRMENPRKFAETILAADQELPQSKVQSLWDKGVNSSVKMDTRPPVHTTYFTVTVDEKGKVSKFKDLYGLDRKAVKVMFGSVAGFPQPPPEPKKRASRSVASSGSSTRSSGGGFANSLNLFGN